MAKFKLLLIGEHHNVKKFNTYKKGVSSKIKVCVLRGVEYLLDDFKDRFELLIANDLSQCARLLQKGNRIDLALFSLKNLRAYEESGELPAGKYTFKELAEIPIILYAHKDLDKDIFIKFKKQIEKNNY